VLRAHCGVQTLIVAHFIVTPPHPGDKPNNGSPVGRKVLEPFEALPAGAIWIDMIEPTAEEDQKVQAYLGCKIPTRADPDFSEPPEAHYAEDGVRYLQARVVSESDTTPDVTDVTFIICDATLVTVRYDESEAFEIFGRKLCRSWGQALVPDAIAVGLVNTIVNLSARALGKVGVSLDQIGSRVFKAQGDNSKRSAVYSATLELLGREDERISNLRESLLTIERLLLFLTAEGRAAETPKPVREATKAALRDLQSLEEDASFKAQKVQFLLDATLGFINLAQNDIIKLFSVLAVIFMPPTMIASIYGMNFKLMPELDWTFGYPLALVVMVLVAVGPYVYFRWRRWL
jgi:magnesium transporter